MRELKGNEKMVVEEYCWGGAGRGGEGRSGCRHSSSNTESGFQLYSHNVIVYKVAIKPIWTYGFELWGCASNSSIAILQRCQSKILRSVADAPRYVTNSTLHNDLGIPFIKDVLR